MKTKADKTIPTIIIAYGLIFIFPLFINLNFKLTTFSIVWASFGAMIILSGFWKIETFEVKENRLTKINFLGLFRRTINFDNIIRYEKKIIDTDIFKNPFSIVKLFSRNKKYLIYRQITIITDKNTKMKLDERTIDSDEFNILYNKIKVSKNRRTN